MAWAKYLGSGIKWGAPEGRGQILEGV